MRRILLLICLIVSSLPALVQADDWSQWRGPTRDAIWREDGIVEKFSGSETQPLWRAPISSGYSGPTVAEGRVFVTDRVKTPEEMERVLCFDAHTGKPLWTHAYPCSYQRVGYPAGPRASVLVDGGRAYSLGARGHLFCLDAATGKVVWKKDCQALYSIRLPIWAIAASPIVEGDLLIVHLGGKDASLVAFDKESGKEVWRALDDPASYSAPIVIDQAGKRVLVCWTGTRVVGLDPKTGVLYWAQTFEQSKMVINIATPVLSGNYLFVSSFYDGSLLLKLSETTTSAERIWRREGKSERQTDSLHCCISTPLIEGEYIYGVDSYGEFRCLDLLTGDRVWESLDLVPKARWANIHMTRHDKDIWMFNERGELLITRLSPKGHEEISRTKIIEPTLDQLAQRGGVCWAAPAFAYRRIYVRNDKEILCVDLAKKGAR